MTVHDIIPLSSEGKGHALTMSSREIAELVGSRHDKVKQSIERLAERGVITLPPLGETSFTGSDGRLQRATEYRVGKRDSYVIVAQLSPEFTARLVDRWQELEARNAVDIRALMNDPAALGKLFLQFADREVALQGQIEEMRPQVQALDRIAQSDGSFCVTDAAKTLQVRPKDLFAFLRSHRWIYSRQGVTGEVAYHDKLANGFLEHKTTTVTRSDGSEKVVSQVRVTPKGLTRLAKEFPPIARLA